ncbi:flagellar hook-basal body complex protein FliE [Pseudorhodobacter aquimaris]|uniref:flagellar hook-basal body complex protein FliE n=1 Tax=Pseudorhodobacter aquimaris TaxID=687412 RepID=UPI00067BD65C|nr:flagellar hook-basal body complex protein FliE [Pseudorhodobacter aquimaris]
MDIKTSVAAQSYAIARQAALPEPKTESTDNTFTKMAEGFANTLVTGETTAKAALVGDADPHSLVQALAATETAIETVVTVRDKVVEAYQELLRMPV